jgi:hypothetical protein
MTYLEAIKAKLSYPLSDSNAFILALTDRGLTSTDTYAAGESFDLAYADLIVVLVTTPNISEGGYSVSLSDRNTLIKIANGIYTKYEVETPLSSLKPTATFVNRW